MKWIRPLNITFLIIAVTIGFFSGKIGGEAFFGFATGLAVWWFRSRDNDKDKEKR